MLSKMLLLTSFLFFGVSSPASGSEAGTKVWSKNFAVKGTPEVVVRAGDGNIQVMPGDAQSVKAEVHVVGWEIGPREVEISDSQSGDRVEIRIRVPHRWRWHTGRRSVDVYLTVPQKANLDLDTADGRLEVRGVAGNFHGHTRDGSILVNDAEGQLDLVTGDGRMEVSGSQGRLRGHTGDGSIRVDGVYSDLQLDTGDGSIEASLREGSRMEGSWSLRTGDGHIRVTLPASFAADLDAHTGDGRITLDMPVTISGALSPTEIRGKLNGGGPTLSLRSGDGSISVEKR
ncbi:MAG TPA: DUF4097 family beta strand repeat-containing protein [Candidatus Acidoferrales bacterium]